MKALRGLRLQSLHRSSSTEPGRRSSTSLVIVPTLTARGPAARCLATPYVCGRLSRTCLRREAIPDYEVVILHSQLKDASGDVQHEKIPIAAR